MLNRCPATELATDVPGGEVCQCTLDEGHEGEHQCHHGFHFPEDKKLCLVHQIARRLCGCGEAPAPKSNGDSHRDFSELAVGTKVRFARAIREVELCGRCREPGVKIESKHRRVIRRAWVHDAVVGPTGYVAGNQCVEYSYPPQKKKRKK